jgi:hypothetical protein
MSQLVGIHTPDFLGDDLDAGGDDLIVLGVVDADALVDVGPGLGEAGEEVMAGDDEDAPRSSMSRPIPDCTASFRPNFDTFIIVRSVRLCSLV